MAEWVVGKDSSLLALVSNFNFLAFTSTIHILFFCHIAVEGIFRSSCEIKVRFAVRRALRESAE